MDTSAVDNLEFRGEDSDECNNFLLAVLKYAFTQGKQRDDEWVADFVATCLTGEALRWWTGLPPPTQGSWKLLRQAMTQKYRPSFYGRSGEEAEKFVHLVFERATDAGKQSDNQWLAEFVPTCFKGEALRWFSSLDPTVRNDWGLLQEAIFRQFPSDDINALSRVTPTSAAARSPANPDKPLKRGRVRVEYSWHGPKDGHVSYLPRELDSDGKINLGYSSDDALEVECDPTCDGLQELFIPDSQLGQYDLLAIRWYSGDTVDCGSLGNLCAVNSRTSTSSMKPSTKYPLHNHWKIVVDSTSTSGERVTIIPTSGALSGAGQLGIYLPLYSDIVYFYSKSAARGASFFFEPL